MKKIYTFTLDDEVPSDELFNDVKVIAHLLYEELKNEEYDTKILVSIDKHKENVLYETKVMNDYQYKFLSEIENDSKTLYEPFLINHIGFGITIYDGSISEPLLNYLFKNVLKTIRKPYNFSIFSIHKIINIIFIFSNTFPHTSFNIRGYPLEHSLTRLI